MLLILLELLDGFLTRTGLYRLVMIFDQLAFRAFAAGLLAFLCVLAGGPRTIAWLRKKKIGDAAQADLGSLEEAMRSKKNTPTMGGLLIGSSILLSVLVFGDLSQRYVQLGLIVLVWLAALGGVDDWLKLTAASRPEGSRQGLFAWEKLLFQLGIGVLIGYFAYKVPAAPEGAQALGHVVNLPFQKTYESALATTPGGWLWYLGPVAYIVVMTVMMTGMSNAVNITDGMDGLASGITAAVAIGLVVLCIISGSESLARELLVPYVSTSGELAVLAAAMAGATLGFLWWNCAPAGVFMGDTGSLLLGGLIGFVAVAIRQEIVVLVMCGMFLVEIGSVVVQVGWFKWTRMRTGTGRRVFRCAPYHWHLRLGDAPETKVVARFWILSVLLVGVALATLKMR
ncbi:MAG: phospho-N-acetylmuramoyl-pentapeptide-transferase [Phycisphaerales bacterium]